MIVAVFALIATWTLQHFWLVVLATIWLATRAVLPRSNPLLDWPVGLLVLISAGYLGFFVFWGIGYQGIDCRFSQVFFSALSVVLAASIVRRNLRSKQNPDKSIFDLDMSVGTLVAVSVPLALITFATVTVYADPVELIARYLSGGDHGRHNRIIHEMMSWSDVQSLASPFDPYGYPRAVHFSVGNMLSLFSGESRLPLLAQEYVIGAWFNWLQFAAYVQLCATIVLSRARSRFALRALTIVALMAAIATIEKYVVHLMWSGFTTSLAMAWILLIPFAWPWRDEEQAPGRERIQLVGVTMWLFFVTLGVYQLYAVMFLVIGALVIVRSGRRGRRRSSFVRRFGAQCHVEPAVVGLLVLVLILAAYFVLGSDGRLVSTLVSAGFTFEVSLPMLIGWALAAGLLLFTVPDRDVTAKVSQLFLAGLYAMAIGYAAVVMLAGNGGVGNFPYYITKLLWLVLFVSVPIACAFGLERVDAWPRSSDVRRHYVRDALVFGAVVVVPIAFGRSPFDVSRHVEIGWFAEEMVKFGSIELEGSVAFSGSDGLGTHVANLALKSRSSINMPESTEFSMEPYLACEFINSQPIKTVFTDNGGRQDLVEALCDPDMRYVEPSQIFEPGQDGS